MNAMQNGGSMAANIIAITLVLSMVAIAVWDAYVKIYTADWPTVSSVISVWFKREPMLRFLAWLLAYHLLVQQ